MPSIKENKKSKSQRHVIFIVYVVSSYKNFTQKIDEKREKNGGIESDKKINKKKVQAKQR